MPKHQFDKLFTPEEANDLIPRLEVLVRELQLEARRLRNAVAALTSTDPSLMKADLSEMLDRHPILKATADQMAELAAQIESFGCFLKDIDQGLVDFPFETDGEVAFLCWQYGEPRIVAWHAIESGFTGRRPLPGVPRTYLN